ncbi:type VII secretion system-associated protein [Streptomyces sp. NPDC004629]|uniref:type VII secretion system-associated protein n=1 Tax=Streptomyces sp. NPDC004629 TaxID=3364705 RepID=UPI00368721EE
MTTWPPSHHLDDLMPSQPTTAPTAPTAPTASSASHDAGTTFRGTPPEPPEPPKEVVEAARLAPDHWISAIDPGWRGEGMPPDFAVAGRWRSGAGGQIEEWEDNDAYRPSPETLGWPEPTDAVDAALQLAVTGYGPAEDVAHALAAADLAVLTLPDGSPVTATAADGTPVVPVFTSTVHLDLVGGFAFARRTTDDLLPQLPSGHHLYVNPSSPAGAVLAPGPLAETIARGTGAGAGAEAGDGVEAGAEDGVPASARTR